MVWRVVMRDVIVKTILKVDWPASYVKTKHATFKFHRQKKDQFFQISWWKNIFCCITKYRKMWKANKCFLHRALLYYYYDRYAYFISAFKIRGLQFDPQLIHSFHSFVQVHHIIATILDLDAHTLIWFLMKGDWCNSMIVIAIVVVAVIKI